MKKSNTQPTMGIAKHALRLLGVSVLSVWVIDTLVILRLFSGSCGLKSHYYGLLRHFAGLMLADVQVGIAVAAGLLIAALLLSRLRFLPDYKPESAILLSSCLISLAVMNHTKFLCSFAGSKPHALICGIAVVLLPLFVILHLLKIESRKDMAGVGFITMASLFPALIAGLTVNSLSRFAERNVEGVFDLGLAIGFVACMLYLWRGHQRAGKALVLAVPLVLSIAFTGIVILRTLDYGGGGVRPSVRGDKAPPSIALIVLDTVRADHLSHYGYGRNTMPYLEKWAQGGIIFERAVSAGGWTTPSHASFFSGRTVSLHGVHYGIGSFVTEPVDGIDWLPELLRAQGYYTLAVSANALAFPSPDLGFDRTLVPEVPPFAFTLGRLADEVLPLLRRASESLRWRVPYADAEGIVRITERALPQPAPAPVFLFVNFLDAHSPYNPPKAALESLGARAGAAFPRYYSHRRLTRQWADLPAGKTESLRDLYDGELRWVDMQLEALLPWLEEALGPKSVIVVVSDHGEELGEEGRVGHESGLSQRILHVPLFIGGGAYPFRKVNEVVTTRRLFDFILSCAGGNVPEPEFLSRADEFTTIAERYPTSKENAPNNPLSHCPKVACFEDSLKVVGPSSCEISVYNIAESDFLDRTPLTGTAAATSLKEFVDAYWETHRDRRGEKGTVKRPSKQELDRLRGLGYID